MNNLFEFFCCPQHGVFRAENLVLFAVYGQNVLVVARMWISRTQKWIKVLS